MPKRSLSTSSPGGQGGEHVHQLFLEQREGGGLAGFTGALVGDEVAQMGVLLLTDGGLQGDGFLGDLEDLPDLVHRHIHLGGDLVGGGVVAQLLEQLARLTRMTLLMVSTICTGIRMVRAWSAMARVMA